MNGRAAKTIRLYCAVRKKEGAGVILKDMKRRYLAVPADQRADVLVGMEYYLAERGELELPAGELRALKARANKIQGKGLGGYILSLLARFMGFSGGSTEKALDKPEGTV